MAAYASDLIKVDIRHLPHEFGKFRFVGSGDCSEAFEVAQPFWNHNAMFRQVRSQGIDYLRALPDQQLARAKQHFPSLLCGRLHWDHSHGRA